MVQVEKKATHAPGTKWKPVLVALIINTILLEKATVAGFSSPKYTFLFKPKVPQTRTSISLNVLTEKDVETLDPTTYEAMLINSWDTNPSVQKGFDWEIEKIRRNFAGLQQLDDGSWERRPSVFDFLVSKSRSSSAEVHRLDEPPKPVNIVDVLILFATNLLSNVGFGPALGMAAVPDAVIQKYEGSFFSFIKGALGGDLQTLAGGPLFLLLAKYYQEYGPIFNLSFGPKSFLVVSDPVMARHILKESSPEQYCKVRSICTQQIISYASLFVVSII
jgi:hypothetical protein